MDLSDCIIRGIEREVLRVDKDGKIAQTPHPEKLGAPLTHPHITTDFSESLLEFITPPEHSLDVTLEFLLKLHAFTVLENPSELLWPSSMPCILSGNESIPIAKYGNSNAAKMKELYRKGLSYRYGSSMQTISGIHYNFSLDEDYWLEAYAKANADIDFKQFKTEKYLGLVRNFKRNSWLLLYLYGASPAVCKSFFTENIKHNLDVVAKNTLGKPFATTLRMSNLGYQSRAQESIFLNLNSLPEYIQSIQNAISTPFGNYANPQWHQLNQNIVQIENEIYSNVRPKQPAESGEPPVLALKNRGIEYVEVRCIDSNPFLPLGINKSQIKFIDSLLLYCLKKESPAISPEEDKAIKRINHNVAYSGLQADLKEVSLNLIREIETVANQINHTVEEEIKKITNVDLTPSRQIILNLENSCFSDFALNLANEHYRYFRNYKFSEQGLWELRQMSRDSINDLKAFEACPGPDFESYLKNYYKKAMS